MFNFFSKSKTPLKLWFSTDIHCHVIPGVDDGSPDAETSVQLVERMADLGLTRIIATPHITDITFPNSAETLNPAQAELDEAMRQHGLTDVTVTHAAENRIDDLFNSNLKAGTVITYPNNWLLIENSYVQEPWELESLVFDLQVRGYKPILAHPERYLYYHRTPQRYEVLHRTLPFQVNLLSLAGYYGRDERRMAENLLERGMVDFIGTDTHGMRHLDCLREYLTTRDARRHAAALARIGNDTEFLPS